MKPEDFLNEEFEKKRRKKRRVIAVSGISGFGAALIIFKVFHFSSHFGGADESTFQINSFRIDSVSQRLKSVFPAWLKQLYPDTLITPHREALQRIISFTKINDSVSYCVYEQSDGVGIRRFLATYVNKKEKENMEIEQNSDRDFSMPHYKSRRYILNPNHSFVVKSFIFSVPDSLIGKNGIVKKEVDVWEIEPIKDSTTEFFEISNTGSIVKK